VERNISLMTPAFPPLPDGDYRFRRTIPVEEGSNTITVEAMDASENVATNVYTVQIGGVLKELEFDLNGNLRYERDDNEAVLREFQWDARNRLVAIIDGDNTTEFEYDGLDRRVRIIEKENDVEQSNVTFLWAGSEILQKRAADTETIIRNYFDDGFTEGTDNFYYTKDHLGSIREVVAVNSMGSGRFLYAIIPVPFPEIATRELLSVKVPNSTVYPKHYNRSSSPVRSRSLQ